MEKIRKLLVAGNTTEKSEAEGYPKSTVYAVAEKVGNNRTQDTVPEIVNDAILELRQKKQILALEKEMGILNLTKKGYLTASRLLRGSSITFTLCSTIL